MVGISLFHVAFGYSTLYKIMTVKEKAPVPYEKEIQRDICEWLHIKHYFFWRQNNIPVFGRNNGGQQTFRSMPKFTPKGIPDIIVINHGDFIGIEVKRPGAKLRPDQLQFSRNITIHGGYYHVATSLDDVIKIMSMYRPAYETQN